jgi:bacillithiol synthase
VRILSRPIGGSALVQDYLREVPSALDFYAGSPYQLETFARKLEDVSGRFGRRERETAARALRPTSDRAGLRLRRFVEDGGAVVTTGQQTGFLSGPMFTVLKAISAAVLADHLERHLGITVLPVFWIASEDHDWAEVNHADLLGPQGRLRRFRLPDVEGPARTMKEYPLIGDLDEICDEILHFVGGEVLTQQYLKRIIDPYRVRGRSVSDAFAETMETLLAPFDILLVDAADGILKEASKPTLKRGLVEAEEQEERLRARTRDLEVKGYSGQVSILERGTNVFLSGSWGRGRLYRRGEDFVIRERRGVFRRDEILEILEEEAGRFSPNVVLRPVVESSVFPTLAYVGGPGEVGYFAQVGAVFGAYGVEPPVAVPRYSATVMEDGVARTLAKLGLQEADLRAGRDEILERFARGEMPPGAAGRLESLRRWIVDEYEGLMDEVDSIDPTLVRSLGGLRNRGLMDVQRGERAIVRAIKRRDVATAKQLDRVLDALRPRGSVQDRVLNIVPFLARYGEGFLRDLESAVQADWRLPARG